MKLASCDPSGIQGPVFSSALNRLNCSIGLSYSMSSSPFDSKISKSKSAAASTKKVPPAAAKWSDVESKEERQKPKRPLSAYNFFFLEQRQQILDITPTRKEGKPRRSHGKIGFADLARSIAAKWKHISPEERSIYDEKAAADKQRYRREMDEWKKWQAVHSEEESSSVAKPSLVAQPGNNATLFGPVSMETIRQPSSLRDDFESIFDDSKDTEEDSSFAPNVDPRSFVAFFGSNNDEPLTQGFSQHLAQPTFFEQNFTQPRQTLQPQRVPQPQSRPTPQSTSPRIADLAARLDEESTKLFLSIFRPPPEY
jgi:hypothetical protein